MYTNANGDRITVIEMFLFTRMLLASEIYLRSICKIEVKVEREIALKSNQ